MKCFAFALTITALLVGPAWAGDVDLNLQAAVAAANDHETVSALVYLADGVDVKELHNQLNAAAPSIAQRHEAVVTTLRQRAELTQPALLSELERLAHEGEVAFYQSFWIANCVRVDATPAVIKELGSRPDVEAIYLNYEIELIEPVAVGEPEEKPAFPTRSGEEDGVVAVRAPEVWAMGFTGEGVLTATLDTGVDGNHEALASRWRGVADGRYVNNPEWAWFDPQTNTTFPTSFGSHGTHTMGTVCGGAPGDSVGVAPGAQWIHAAVIDRVDIPTTVSDAILAFQWLVDPDGNPTTNWDVPSVCSNSWGVTTSHGYAPCDETFWSYIDACEAAGIVVLFSAGNEGTSGLRRPGDRATTEYNACAVAAIDEHTAGYPIADFSSRGPTYCTPTGDAAIKPDIAAPGVDTRSSMPGGSYGTMSGTSMASPHVNGVAVLMREACPDLTPDEVKQIMYETATDLGTPGEDNSYGWGIVDAYEAVNEALGYCSGAPRARDVYVETPVDQATMVALVAMDYDGLPDPPAALTYIITSLPANGTLADANGGYVIGAGDLPYSLVSYGNEVVYTPDTGYYGTDQFEFKANDGGVPPDAGDSNVAAADLLVLYDPPTITTTSLPSGLVNGSYGPVQLEAAEGQPELTWAVLPAGEYFETDLGSNGFAEVGTAQGWNADDDYWTYSLPFSFPFFGEEYTTAYVGSNGYINFGSGDTEYDNSDSGLMAAARIAALWDDLKTNESGNDIFIYEDIPGQVTIRWDAVTYTGSYACAFSITLYSDGLIQVHYGPGNTGLTPTIGVSAGDGSLYMLSSYNNSSTLTNANSLQWQMPAQLPEGMAVSTDGVLSGIPAELGMFQPTFRVTDSLGRSDQAQLELEINSGPVPPIAEDQSVSSPVNTAIEITLVANDDGLPEGGSLTYTVESLPASGTLTDVGGGLISAVPYTLVAGGNVVSYQPAPWYVGDDSFTFMASDGGTPPDGGDSNTATVSVEITPPAPQTAYLFTFDTDPGWSTEGFWQFGTPTGGGSHAADPAAGYTGASIYGYNLFGDYANSMPAYNLTSTAIDCSNLADVELRFWRWLGVERSPYDNASVSVSNNGTDWTTLWSNPSGGSLSDDSWSQMTFDISAVADGQATVYLRWTMGETDSGTSYPGWNIDDVELFAVVLGPACPGDFDGSGTVDLADLQILLSNYGQSGIDQNAGDMDADGDVDLSDLQLLLSVYGNAC